ncbi:MAG: alpha/beta fold hydrolase [Polyangiaceae bacterium]
MTALFFGESKSPLFGVLHEPAPGTELHHAVLVCPPIGQEHVRSHWALRQLGSALARSGHHVLRFDWFGVGDSAGDLTTASLDRWVEDAATAAEELRDSTGIRRVSIVGLRLGATLAMLAAKAIKPATLVLWDVVADGDAYIEGLRALHEAALHDEKRFWPEWPRAVRPYVERIAPGRARPREREHDELIGVRMSHELTAAIRAVDVARLADLPKTRVFAVSSAPNEDADKLWDELAERNVHVDRATTRMQTRWADVSQLEELLLPADAIRTILRALDQRKTKGTP